MSKILLLVSCILICLALVFTIDFSMASAAPPKPTGPVVGPSVKGVSFNGDLRKLPYTKPKDIPLPPRPTLGSQRQSQLQPSAPLRDPVRQAALAPLNMPGLFRSFDGLGFPTWGARLQPDATGDAGPNHYIQTLNTSLAIFDKNGNRLAAATFNDWWYQPAQTGPCYNRSHHGNPIVVYDARADRWLISDMAGANLKFYWCIAVSKSGDPVAGGWWFYAYIPDPVNNYFPDDPRVGVWPDAFYMSSILLNPNQGWAWTNIRAFALDRASMFNGTLNSVYFDIGLHPNFVTPLWVLPSNLRGAPPPAGAPNFFVTVQDPNSMWLWKFHVDWTNPISSTLTGPAAPLYPPTLTTAPFTGIFTNTFVLQPNGIQLDPHGDDRLLPQLQYRNIGGTESLWAAQVVSSSAVSGIRWYEIRNPNGTPTIYQQGTFQPDLNYRFLPSIAADGNGNAAIGYTISSSSIFPSIMYGGRLASDPLGTLGQGEATLLAGTGAQSNPNDHGWGDYTTLTVDPVDDCTFWFNSEYYTTTSSADNWSTRIAAFKYPSCNPTPYPTNHTVMFDGLVTQNVEWNPNGDKLGSMNGIDYYATWDANHLSVAMAGGAVNTNTYIVAVDTDSTNRSPTNTGASAPLVCAGFNGNGKGDFALGRSAGGTAKYQVSGGTWVGTWAPIGNTAALDNGSNNVEFQFQWSDLGLKPANTSIGLYLYVCNGTSLVSAWPPENVQAGTNPTLNTEVVFSTNDAGRIPRTYGRHVGDEQATVSPGGPFNLLNGHVRLSNVSGVSGCTFTASVNGNADTSDPNTIRRIYTLTPGTGCLGLTTDLTLKYEDGTLNNAPDELAGFTESSLKLLRWSGTSWSPLPTTVDTVNNTATATSINQFSPWSLGKGAPTAVTISSFTATPSSMSEAGSQSVLGLGLVELLAGGLAFSARRRVRQKGYWTRRTAVVHSPVDRSE